MISSISYNGDGSTRIFPVSFKINGEDYVRVYVNSVEVVDRTKYDIINNSIVFTSDNIPTIGTDNIQIYVATSSAELGDLGAPLTDITNVSNNLDAILAVSTTVVPNIDEILLADNNATIATTQANLAIAAMNAAEISEDNAAASVVTATAQAGIATTKAGEASASAISADASADIAVAAKDTAVTKAGEASTSASQALEYRNEAESFADILDPSKIVAKDSPTGSAMIPAGTTAQRPVSPSDGYMRYNTDLLKFEGYQSGVWSPLGGLDINTLTAKIRLADGDIIPIGDSSSGFASKYITYDNLKRSIPNGIRQTVQSASVDANGQPNFITIGTGLSVNILATTTNIMISAAGYDTDRIGKITADTTITGLIASATNYLYADIASDGTLTFSTTTYAPIYQQGYVPSTTLGQHTFNIGEMKMYVGNGSTYTQVFRVFIGECVTGSSTVTSVTNYALNGYYDSGWINTLPTVATAISKNCNIGSVFQTKYLDLKCLTSDAGYSIGDVLSNVSISTSSGSYLAMSIKNTANTVSFKTGANAAFQLVNYSTGALSSITLASWAYKIISKRNW